MLGWLLLGALALNGCGYSSKNIFFKDRKYNDYYRAQRKQGKPAVVSYKADTTMQPYGLVTGDVVRIQFVNVCEPMLVALSRSSGAANTAQAGGTRMSGNAQGGAEGMQGAGILLQQGLSYTVDEDGRVALPLLGRLLARGLTARQLRDSIETRLRSYCTDEEPTIELTVATLRAFVFNEGGRQGLVQLPSEKTHITEFLALAGGVSFVGKANKIQIIRGSTDYDLTRGIADPQVIWVDLQQMDALRYSNLNIYPNDIVYVEPRELARVSREVQTLTAFAVVLNFAISIVLLTQL